jgi:subtilisin-like proprotein convertase family protein
VTNGYTTGNKWGGTSPGYPSFITTAVNLPVSAQGQSVQLRWRFMADISVSGIGWYVDSIRVGGGFVCCDVPPPPAIVSQPSDANADAGGDTSFTVSVSGWWPMSFQWQRDGVNLPFGTNQTLSLTGISTNDAGNYSVLVTNAYGAATSSKAYLTVLQPEIVNATQIAIGDADVATPYPSLVVISGQTGTVANVTVTLRNVYHTFPDDLDVLLVSPSGASVLLMSDAGGHGDLTGATLLFDDQAINTLPDAGQIVSGTYRPTNFGLGDAFPPPAPASGYGTNLAGLRGDNPNGAWKLFVYDDEPGDTGSISGGWSLRVTTANPPAPDFLPAQIIGGQIRLRFLTAIGGSYIVQYKNSLTDPVWTDLQTVSGDGTIKTVSDSTTGAARFYRIRTP